MLNKNFNIQSMWFRAPEICFKLPYDEAIDIWSTGCIIYEIFVKKKVVWCLGYFGYFRSKKTHILWKEYHFPVSLYNTAVFTQIFESLKHPIIPYFREMNQAFNRLVYATVFDYFSKIDTFSLFSKSKKISNTLYYQNKPT